MAISVAPYSVSQDVLETYTSESNPFVPTCYDDLLAAIQTAGIYVKLESDFDFKNSDGSSAGDSGWRDGLSSSASTCLLFSCAKLFAADKPNNGGKYSISGLNSGTARSFIDFDSSSNHVIENIALVNCVTTLQDMAYNTSHILSWNASNNNTVVINNCQFSILCICGGFELRLIIPNTTFNNCSIYVGLSKTNYSPCYIHWSINQCTFQITGLKTSTTRPSNSSGSSFTLFKNLTNSTLFADISLTYGMDSYINLNYITHCCIILNVSWDSASASKTAALYFHYQTMSGITVIDETLLDNASITKPADSNVVYLSTTEMKDKTALIDSGFLP